MVIYAFYHTLIYISPITLFSSSYSVSHTHCSLPHFHLPSLMRCVSFSPKREYVVGKEVRQILALLSITKVERVSNKRKEGASWGKDSHSTNVFWTISMRYSSFSLSPRYTLHYTIYLQFCPRPNLR